jgi:hypothetical protein
MGGWTQLTVAIEFIQTTNAGVTPEVYGCKSWRQVIQESHLFGIEKRANPNGRQIWYRSEPSAT